MLLFPAFCVLGAAGFFQSDSASVQALLRKRLRPGFTLVFDVVSEDLRTRAMRQETYDRTASQFAAGVKAGQMTKEMSDQMLNGLRKEISTSRPPERYTLTLSASGSTLLMQEMRPNKRPYFRGCFVETNRSSFD